MKDGILVSLPATGSHSCQLATPFESTKAPVAKPGRKPDILKCVQTTC